VIDYALLGPLEARIDGRPIDLGGPRQRAVLAVLLVERNRIVSADRLIELVWGEDPPPTAETALQGHVSKLRQLLGRDAIRTERPGYALDVPVGALDVDRLEAAVRAAGEAPGEPAAAALREALAGTTETPLDGLEIGPVGAAEVQRLEQLRLTALETLIDLELDLGRLDAVLGDLERLVAVHPYHERFHGQRMLALYRAGRQADALAAYQAARVSLDESLGIDPGPDLRELERRILVQDPGLDAPGHRPRSTLPSPTTALIGRTELVEAIADVISAGTRIVTLTGPGGTGKTRLAIGAAAAIADRFPDGSFWIGCASLTEARLVLDAIASTIGGTGDLADRVGDGRVLLVVDNLEQVLTVAADLATLASRCPNLALLVTSRERLGIRGEREVPVPALDLDDAVALFAERSRLEPDATVRELCAGLDALPLAIELAAARTKILTPGQILARLGDRLDFLKGGPDLDLRQRTLRRTIDWSYELLQPDERRVFRALAAFPAGATLEAALELTGADVDQLEALAARSLVRLVGGRFVLLETIRAYGREALGAAGETEALEDAIAAWALRFVVAQDAHVRGPAQVAALAALDAELDTIRLAFRRLVERGESDGAARLVLAAQWWMRRRGRAAEVLRWNREALALPVRDPSVRGWLLLEEIISIADVEPEIDLLGRIEAALAYAEALGDRPLIASVLEQRSVRPPFDDALLERTGELFAELGMTNDRIRVAINAAWLALSHERFELAVERGLAAHELVVTTGNDHGIGVTLLNLAAAYVALDRDAEAWTALAGGLAAIERVGDLAGRLEALELGAALLARDGDVGLAAILEASAASSRVQHRLERDVNDRRLVRVMDEARDAAGGASGGAPPLELDAALERLREALRTRRGDGDVPSGR
jgi:predicted ATPase/DNA-binding SARP family transcriptional activator